MRPPGSFKLGGRKRRGDDAKDPLAPAALCGDREGRIVDSLRAQILESDVEQCLRIRQVFFDPKEIFRVEIDRPTEGYLRTTLLDRDALEDLLATDDVRARIAGPRDPLG